MRASLVSHSTWFSVKNHLAVARLDHWFKGIMVLPGIGAGVLFLEVTNYGNQSVNVGFAFLIRSALVVLLSCFVSSTNYIINEVLDARFDAKHPTKCKRPVPSGLVNVPILLLMAAGFLIAALFLASWLFSESLVYSLSLLFLFGLLYNVPPIRAKDLPYVDVLCESANNPIRLLIGWFGVGVLVLPPISLLISYWAIGGFLMTAKRYSELRFIGDSGQAAAYRKSFKYYTIESLMLAMITYLSVFMYCFGFITVRYKLELLLAMPLILGFVAWFFHLAFQKDSVVKEPEKVVKEPIFVTYTLLTFLVVMVCGLAKLDWLWNWFTSLNIGIPIG